MPRRNVIVATVAILVMGAAGVTASGLLTGTGTLAPHKGEPSAASARGAGGPALVAGSGTAFALLSQQRSNRCDLQAGELMRYRPSRRMQGSCCSPMDRATYRHQVEHVRRYARLSEIPRDPYNISAGLAQRLLRYDTDVRLNAAQQRTYERAMQVARSEGPCCCACWRYAAFRGLSEHLIAERAWPAARLARLIEALDGCGGTADEHKHA